MSTAALKHLEVAHLRGAVTPFLLEFDRGKKLTIIYGENGTGKSTICDAFDFLGRGSVGSLDNKGLGKTSPYWCSMGKIATDVTVALASTSGVCTGTIAKGRVVVDPPGDRPHIEVLRRGRILSLLETTPASRYEAIRRFIDVSAIEAGEDALREEIKTLEATRANAAAGIAANRATIEQFWIRAGSPSANAFVWASQQLALDATAFDGELSALGALRRSYERLGDDVMRRRIAEEATDTARAALADAEANLTRHATSIAAGAATTAALLQAARMYLSAHPAPVSCPLCESTQSVKGLLERVQSRLETFSELQNAQETVAAQRAELSRTVEHERVIDRDAVRHRDDFLACVSGTAWSDDIVLPSAVVPVDVSEWADWLAATSELTANWGASSVRRQEDRKFLATLRDVLATYEREVQAQELLAELLPRMHRALQIVETERRRLTDDTLASIAAAVGELYELVHPGEGLNKIALALDPKRRASLEIEASFGGKSGMRPQAYFSDSHLDTLGLCVFLALATRDGAGDTILVLDDVLGSVDEPHVDRLIEMLFHATSKFRHCVITTHYRPWRNKFRWGWLKSGQCQFVELTKWTATGGLTVVRSTPDLARLRQFLAESPANAQDVCARAGVILEATLDFLTLQYGCQVPRKVDALYTLGELLPAIDKKLRAALAVERLDGETGGKSLYSTHALGPILDELTRIAQVRNLFGAHFNRLSFDLLDSEAITFGSQVLALAELLTDEDAGWPRSDKSGSYWATSGETRRLHPLKRPS